MHWLFKWILILAGLAAIYLIVATAFEAHDHGPGQEIEEMLKKRPAGFHPGGLSFLVV